MTNIASNGSILKRSILLLSRLLNQTTKLWRTEFHRGGRRGSQRVINTVLPLGTSASFAVDCTNLCCSDLLSRRIFKVRGHSECGEEAKNRKRVKKETMLVFLPFLPSLPFLLSSAIPSYEAHNVIDFNRDIRPILADKCWGCHGPDATAKKIRLRLDSETAATADLGRGRRAIVPGNVEQSQLVRRITASDESMRMPPVDSGRKLTQPEIDLLIEWVRQGARWQRHWSFITPTRPALPDIKNGGWPKNAIDNFALARLER